MMARHPDLTGYISDVLLGLRPWLEQRTAVEKVSVVLLDLAGTVLERFVFEVSDLIAQFHTVAVDSVEASLREYLIRINSVALRPIGKE